MQHPDLTTLPAAQLTSHQPPALLVERIIAVRPDGGRVRVAEHGELDALQLIEASAQSLAVLMGARLRQGTAGSQARASGMLVGAKGFAIQRGAAAGERVDIDAVLDCEFGPLQLYRLTIHAGEALEVIGAGELKVASVAGNP